MAKTNKDNIEEEVIRKTSMFCYRASNRIEYDTTCNKSRLSAKSLFERGTLKSGDKAILDLLNSYTYLNAYMIRCLITGSETGGNERDRKPVQKMLKALMKSGLIRRFRIIYTDEFCVEYSTPFIYQLGSASTMNVRKDDKGTQEAPIPTPLDVVSRLSLNQFLITVTLQYMYKKIYIARNYGMKGSDAQVFLTLTNNNGVGFNIISIRSDEKWRDTLNTRLASRLNSYPYLIICESEQAAMEIERFHKKCADISAVAAFYVCDYATISGDMVFEQIIAVNPIDNFSSYDVCKFDIG
jgi:hypothetical protein